MKDFLVFAYGERWWLLFMVLLLLAFGSSNMLENGGVVIFALLVSYAKRLYRERASG